MKVPLIWLRDYLDISHLSPQEIAADFTALGLMLDKPIESGVLDLEHRMDRSDWLSIVGCARDLAAFTNLQLHFPPLYTKPLPQAPQKLAVPVNIQTDVVKRFQTLIFTDIQVGPSPKWLKTRLESYGIPSINNIVDITNFVMVELGQPMHAQDLDKFTKRELILKETNKQEKITTLLGETLLLPKGTFVLTQNNQPITIGGIVGGKQTGITSQTTTFILDAGNYDQRYIRHASRRLKIYNETVLRYDKFLHPHLTTIALQRATYLILKIAGGKVYRNTDWYPHPVKPLTKTLTLKRIKTISGLEFSSQQVANILSKLGYKILQTTSTSFLLEIPYFRTDIQVEDDIVSDILRISNYAHLPSQPLSTTPPQEISSSLYLFEEKLKDILTRMGFHEHITDPLIPKTGQADEIILANALTSEKSALRTSLLTTLQKVAQTYHKHNHFPIALFEIGKTYHQKKPSPQKLTDLQETRKLAIIYQDPSLSLQQTLHHLHRILKRLSISLNLEFIFQPLNSTTATILLNSQPIGQLTPTSAELEITPLYQHHTFTTPLATNPHSLKKEDLSLLLPINLAFGPLLSQIKHLSSNLVDLQVIEEFQDKNLAKNKQKSLLLRLYLHPATNSQLLKEKILAFLKPYHVSLKNT